MFEYRSRRAQQLENENGELRQEVGFFVGMDE